MGFCLRSKITGARHRNLGCGWQYLHYLLSLLMPLMFIALVGCIKQPEISSPPLGPEVAFEELDEIIDEALIGLNPYSIGEGQKVLRDQFMTVELPPRQKLGIQYTEVSQVRLIGDLFFVLYQDEETSLVGEEAPILVEEVIALPSSCETEENTLNSKASTLIRGKNQQKLTSSSRHFEILNSIRTLREQAKNRIKTQMLKIPKSLNTRLARKTAESASAEEQPIVRVSLHNLSHQKLEWPIPDFIRSRTQCGDIPNCTMPSTEISYRLALWTSETAYESLDSKLLISTNAPYFGLILSDCREQQPVIGERDYFIRVCDDVSDFYYGQPLNCDESEAN